MAYSKITTTSFRQQATGYLLSNHSSLGRRGFGASISELLSDASRADASP